MALEVTEISNTGEVHDTIEHYTPGEHLAQIINETWNFSGKLGVYEECPRDHHMNAILGLVGEAGEVADLYKKVYYHNDKPGWKDELLNECGDLLYYLIKTLALNGWTIEDALIANRMKLMQRHHDLFGLNRSEGK